MTSDATSPAAAEAEAEAARSGLANTLSQLRENLKPSNMVDEVMTNAKVNASVVTDQIWSVARRNPLPALLIGAGAAMLLGFGTRLTGSSAGEPSVPSFRSNEPFRSKRAAVNAGADMLDQANTKLTSAASRGTAALRSATQRLKNSGDTMTSMPQARAQMTNTLARIIEEQPLVLAAVGIAVGAALGAAIPQTETENSLMGETSGSVRTAAQGLVQNQVGQLKAAASHAVDDIKQTAAQRGLSTDNLSGLVNDIGQSAKTATYEAAKTLDPSKT